MKQSGSLHQIVVHAGANHAFHNDTGERYVAEQAQKAWIATMEWFTKHLA